MSTLKIEHIGEDGVGNDIYLVDGELEVYFAHARDLVHASGMLSSEFRRRGIRWDDVVQQIKAGAL